MFITPMARGQSWQKGMGMKERPSGDNPSGQPFAGNTSQKGKNRKDKTELEEATGLTPTSEKMRNQIQKIEVPGKILLC